MSFIIATFVKNKISKQLFSRHLKIIKKFVKISEKLSVTYIHTINS